MEVTGRSSAVSVTSLLMDPRRIQDESNAWGIVKCSFWCPDAIELHIAEKAVFKVA